MTHFRLPEEIEVKQKKSNGKYLFSFHAKESSSKQSFFLIILNLFRIIIDKLIEHEIPLMPFGIWLFAKKIEEKQRRLYFKQVRHSSIYGINSWKCHCETQARYRFILLTEFPQEFCQQSVMTVCKVQNARPYSIWVGVNGLVCCLARALWNWNWHNVLSAKWCGKKDDQKNKKKERIT